jgi:hypothetical protein
VERRTFPNPWWDARNQLSPREFIVRGLPVASEDVLDFYEVLSDFQVPSVLAVVNGQRAGDNKGDRVVGQYVTVEGAKRALLP